MSRAKEQSFSASTARIFNLYGPGEKAGRLVPQIITALAHSHRVAVGSAERFRDIVHVDDAALAIVRLLKLDLNGAVNIANGTPTRMGDLYALIDRIAGRKNLIGIGERADTPGEPLKLYADASLIRSTGWSPSISLEQGLQEMWAQASLPHAA